MSKKPSQGRDAQTLDAKGFAIMTDVNVSPASVPGSPAQVAPNDSGKTLDANVPNPNMTGAEATAWVQAQKAKEAGAKERDPSGKFVAGGKAESTTPDPLKEAAAETMARRKLKVDQDEVDEDEVIKVYKDRKGHQQAANKKFQEGLLARKQAEEFVTMMRDPDKFFEVGKKLGLNPRELAEKLLAQELETELMDPRDRELKDAKARLKQIEDMETKAKAEKERQVHEALKSKYAKDYSDQFVSALQETGLPATKPMVAEMAKYISRSAKIGFEMTAAEAAQLVKEDIQAVQQRLFADADGDTLIKLLGPELANKVRKWDTSRVKSPEQNLKTPEQQGEPRKPRGAPNRKMTPAEWRAFNRS